MTLDDLKSELPKGVPLPVGDQKLWNDCMKYALLQPHDPDNAHFDVMALYAKVRGISKSETFIFRYGGVA